MGDVYVARDGELDRLVALKLLQRTESAEARARFVREARAAGALEHPNIVRIYDVGEHEGRPFIAMQLVHGHPLRDYIGDASVSEQRRTSWLVGIARALDAAHRAGVVHRDVKPENVVIGDDDEPCVLDFGIARAIQSTVENEGTTLPAGLETITSRGVMVGTPHYMAPEQLRNEPLDGRADQFAWGILAFELLSGERPWEAKDAVALLSHHLATPAPPLDQAHGVSSEVSTVIARALAKDPAARFPSMREAAEALERASSSSSPRPPTPRPPPPPPPPTPLQSTTQSTASSLEPRNTPAPHRRRPAFLAAVAVLAAVGTVLLAGRARRTSSTEEPATANANAGDATRTSTSTGVGLLDLPRPKIASPQAEAAYVAGLRAQRDWDPDAVLRHFTEATRLEPDLAAAYVRLGYVTMVSDTATSRLAFAQAARNRDRLGERDLALLEALSPWYHEPSDPLAAADRLAQLSKRYPRDAELLMLEGGARAVVGNPAEALPILRRALEADPQYACAAAQIAIAELMLGNVRESYAVSDACVKAVPTSPQCWLLSLYSADAQGDRETCARNATASVAALPNGVELAIFRAALGVGIEPRAMSDDALRRALASVDPSERDELLAEQDASLDVLDGNLGRAAKTLETHAGGRSPRLPYVRTEPTLLLALEEAGDHAGLARVAKEKERAAQIELPQTASMMTLLFEERPETWHALRASGAWTSAQVEDARNTYEAQWRTRAPSLASLLWFRTRAQWALTEEEARATLEHLPDGGAPKSFFQTPALDAAFGRFLMLSGRPAEARPWLESATKTCRRGRAPITYVRALYDLGRTSEALGDRDRACTAYSEVLARWGAATPRSLTAEATRKRVAALSCPPLSKVFGPTKL